jgi:hypothetical protein
MPRSSLARDNRGHAVWGLATNGATTGGPKTDGTASGGVAILAVVSVAGASLEAIAPPADLGPLARASIVVGGVSDL